MHSAFGLSKTSGLVVFGGESVICGEGEVLDEVQKGVQICSSLVAEPENDQSLSILHYVNNPFAFIFPTFSSEQSQFLKSHNIRDGASFGYSFVRRNEVIACCCGLSAKKTSVFICKSVMVMPRSSSLFCMAFCMLVASFCMVFCMVSWVFSTNTLTHLRVPAFKRSSQ